jgi:hypothetical protein
MPTDSSQDLAVNKRSTASNACSMRRHEYTTNSSRLNARTGDIWKPLHRRNIALFRRGPVHRLIFVPQPIIIMGNRVDLVPFRLNDENLRRLISETSVDTARVFFTAHSRIRMRQRKITRTQVYDCLRRGSVLEPAHQNMHGHWQCTLNRKHAGDEVTVAAALERESDGDWVIVITVY